MMASNAERSVFLTINNEVMDLETFMSRIGPHGLVRTTGYLLSEKQNIFKLRK
jgi:hypothetical protein